MFIFMFYINYVYFTPNNEHVFCCSVINISKILLLFCHFLLNIDLDFIFMLPFYLNFKVVIIL